MAYFLSSTLTFQAIPSTMVKLPPNLVLLLSQTLYTCSVLPCQILQQILPPILTDIMSGSNYSSINHCMSSHLKVNNS